MTFLCVYTDSYLLLVVICENGDVRLANGMTNIEGRVEICRNAIWGTVCDTAWDEIDASIVCRQLGFSRFRKFNTAIYLTLAPLVSHHWWSELGNETLCKLKPLLS